MRKINRHVMMAWQAVPLRILAQNMMILQKAASGCCSYRSIGNVRERIGAVGGRKIQDALQARVPAVATCRGGHPKHPRQTYFLSRHINHHKARLETLCRGL